MSTIIYGASDDLIEIRGDIDDEIGAYYYESQYLALSNGVLLKMKYDDDGEWVIKVKHQPDGVVLNLHPARGEDADDDEDGCPGYSQKLVIDTPVTWILQGKTVVR